MKPVIGVLALQGDVPEHLRALEAAGATATPVRRPEELERGSRSRSTRSSRCAS
jgi:glutamine amidotransferase PdxT